MPDYQELDVPEVCRCAWEVESVFRGEIRYIPPFSCLTATLQVVLAANEEIAKQLIGVLDIGA